MGGRQRTTLFWESGKPEQQGRSQEKSKGKRKR